MRNEQGMFLLIFAIATPVVEEDVARQRSSTQEAAASGPLPPPAFQSVEEFKQSVLERRPVIGVLVAVERFDEISQCKEPCRYRSQSPRHDCDWSTRRRWLTERADFLVNCFSGNVV